MNRTDFSSALVRYGIKSLGADSAAPLAICRLTPKSRGMQVANVVLPKPGGPSNRIWPSVSPRFCAASTAIAKPLEHRPLADHLAHPLGAQIADRPQARADRSIAAAARAQLDSRSAQ